jgi:hypothetical protein
MPVDLSALPGQTLGERAGAKQEEYVKTPFGELPAELAEALKKYAIDSPASSVSASEAAKAGQSVSSMQGLKSVERQLLSEKRYTVMVTARKEDNGVISGSINGLPYNIPVGVQIPLPYSLVSLMVDLGRLAPPPGCEELTASAINAGSLHASTELAKITSSRPGGYYHGDAADAALAAQIEAMTQLNIQQQVGRALPSNLRDFQAPPALTIGGTRL